MTTVTRSTCTENSILYLRRSARNSARNMSAPGQRDFKFSFALPYFLPSMICQNHPDMRFNAFFARLVAYVCQKDDVCLQKPYIYIYFMACFRLRGQNTAISRIYMLFGVTCKNGLNTAICTLVKQILKGTVICSVFSHEPKKTESPKRPQVTVFSSILVSTLIIHLCNNYITFCRLRFSGHVSRRRITKLFCNAGIAHFFCYSSPAPANLLLVPQERPIAASVRADLSAAVSIEIYKL